jgi:hypothetical protein
MRGGVKCESSRGQAIGSAEPQLSPSRATYLVDVRTAVAEGKGVVLFHAMAAPPPHEISLLLVMRAL